MKNKIPFLVLTFAFGICVLILSFIFLISNLKTEIEIEPEISNSDAYDIDYIALEPIEPDVWFPISDHDRHVIECMVAGEARGESFEGQKLVAQCIYSAMRLEGYSADEVRTTYGYEGWFDNPELYPEVAKAVSEVFDEGLLEVDDYIFYFYAPSACTSGFHEKQRFVIEEGSHRFFGKWE